jgi:hypothetical protein
MDSFKQGWLSEVKSYLVKNTLIINLRKTFIMLLKIINIIGLIINFHMLILYLICNCNTS